jgi:acyl-CoA hydrolase
MDVQTFITHHLVKSEDLNHHGTLYAGRSAEWFVESGFTAAAILTKPENIVCMQIHGMSFSRPVRRGEIVRFESKVIHTGRSRMVTYIRMMANEQKVVEGFITFVHVDSEGKALPHGIEIVPTQPEDIELLERAKQLSN